MFDDFDLGRQVEEFYDDAEYWEAMMNEEMHEDEGQSDKYEIYKRTN